MQTPMKASETSLLSEQKLLTQARFLRNEEPQESIELANKALQLATENLQYNFSSQAHLLLGELNGEMNNIDLSIEHLLLASITYKHINDTNDVIQKSIDEVLLLLSSNDIEHVSKLIDELHPVALQYGYALPFAQTLIAKGYSEYKKKHYEDAITQYTLAEQLLSEPNEVTQTSLAETYKKLAETYKRLKNREQTVFYYKETLGVFTRMQDFKNMARTLNTLAEAERYIGNYVSALDYSMRSLEIHKSIQDPEGEAKALTGAGIIYRYIGRYEKSLNHMYDAHQYYKKVNDVEGIAATSNQMGLIYTRLKQFDLAKSFYQLTIDLPENKMHPKTLASASREMAVILLNAGDYDAAKLMIEKAHKIYEKLKNRTNQSLTFRITGNIFRAQNNNAVAISYYKKSLNIAREVNSKAYQVKALLPLGAILIGEDTEEAIRLLKRCLALSLKIDLKSYQLYSYRELHNAEKEQGNFEEALDFAEKQIALTEIIQKEREDKELVLVKATLHSHTKEMELVSLKEKAKLDHLELAKKNNDIALAGQVRRISELELIKNKYANFALVCLLVICLLAVMFIYRQFVNSRKHNKELKHQAGRDPLTGCYNRRVLFKLMDIEFESLKPFADYCIIMVDIDHFKAVNDTHGHIAGDAVLCEVASILQSCVRESDIVARFGGEEFCIVLPKTSKEQGMFIAETMRQKIEVGKVNDITVSCSFGVTSAKFNAQLSTELIEQADTALYQSKANGRNRVTLWDPKLEK